MRQDLGAGRAHRVLGGDDDEGLGGLAGDPVYGDAALLHHLQQGRLGLGGGAVDLVGQKEIADRRAGLVLKIAQLLVVDGEAGDVRRHDVGGKLHAVVVQREGLGEGHGQGGLAHAGDVVEEDVTLCQQGHEDLGGDVVLADHCFFDFRKDALRLGVVRVLHAFTPFLLCPRDRLPAGRGDRAAVCYNNSIHERFFSYNLTEVTKCYSWVTARRERGKEGGGSG